MAVSEVPSRILRSMLLLLLLLGGDWNTCINVEPKSGEI